MNIWDKEFYKEGTGFRDDIFRIPHQDIPKFIELLREINATNVLDLGCGTGRHVIVLAKKGFSVFGMDIAEEALKVMRERLEEESLKADLRIGNMYEKLPYEDNFFNGVISIKVLHHGKTSQIKGLVKEIERIMKLGGDSDDRGSKKKEKIQ